MVELLCLQLFWGAFLLTITAFEGGSSALVLGF